MKVCSSVTLPAGFRWAEAIHRSELRHVVRDGSPTIAACRSALVAPSQPTSRSLACSLCLEAVFTGAERREQGAAS